MPHNPLRFVVVGAGRGRSFAHSAQHIPDQVRLVGICDISDHRLSPWRGQAGITCYRDLTDVLADDRVDAICLATPAQLHARQAIEALRAGKHVLSEVPACYTLEECRELVATVRATGKTYMMAENYCYMREVMMVGEMVRRGVFGQIISAEGHYLHDCRDLYFANHDGTKYISELPADERAQAELTWRGELQRDWFCNAYPTHSLGPVCQWLGINREDRLVSTSTWHSGAATLPAYARRNIGADSPMAAPDFWKLPARVTTMLSTARQVLISHHFDPSSPRPHKCANYVLQGTHAAFSWLEGEPLVWIEDRSPTSATGIAESWEPLTKYADEFEHPLWRQHGNEAAKAGHGGGDFFMLREFADAIREGRPPAIDVVDAVTWSSLSPLSAQSMRSGNATIAVPDFSGAVKAGAERSSR
jgi:predicted dehydrogenase